MVEGRDARLTCDVNAYPPWTAVNWYSDDGSTIPEAFNETVYSIKKVSTELTNQIFRCDAVNNLGQSENSSCQIDVQCKYRMR